MTPTVVHASNEKRNSLGWRPRRGRSRRQGDLIPIVIDQRHVRNIHGHSSADRLFGARLHLENDRGAVHLSGSPTSLGEVCPRPSDEEQLLVPSICIIDLPLLERKMVSIPSSHIDHPDDHVCRRFARLCGHPHRRIPSKRCSWNGPKMEVCRRDPLQVQAEDLFLSSSADRMGGRVQFANGALLGGRDKEEWAPDTRRTWRWISHFRGS